MSPRFEPTSTNRANSADRPSPRRSAEQVDDPEERFIRVLQYYLAGWHIKPKGVKKPCVVLRTDLHPTAT